MKRFRKKKTPSEVSTEQPFFPKVQPKLRVGEPDDAFEKEADHMAEVVTKATEKRSATPSETGSNTLQTKPEEETEAAVQTKKKEEKLQPMEEEEVAQMKAEEEDVQRKNEEEEEPLQRVASEEELQRSEEQEEEMLQTKADTHTPVSTTMEAALAKKSGSGKPMDAKTKADMEQGFGASFDQVQVHTDQEAETMNEAIGAQAFTHGQDIYFLKDNYQPQSSEGKKLLAHELTHTLQQRGSLQPYRDKKATNFGSADSGALKEDTFHIDTDKKKKPYIKKITIALEGTTKKDKNGVDYYTGTLQAVYAANGHEWADISIKVSAGSTHHKTSEANHKVHRIEGQGYMSSDYSAPYTPDPKNKRYNKDKTSANMHYAIFFKGAQAIHIGALDEASHGCVHVADATAMRQLNYHSVNGLTIVVLTYS
ncbi:MAG: hypothetical protein CMC35_06770 [Flavobacteriaceae bacterium]|nr:hypothetical protein [Flavobacteriaceae bacterium]|tara:strand:+ start:16459 stop:17730 length:1272 start_codon:yes stop_codon:yes gene_type:complete